MTLRASSELHADSIIIDAACPLAKEPVYLDWYRQGGATVVAPTIGGRGSAQETLGLLALWQRTLRERSDLILVQRASDIRCAKQRQRLGVYFHFQGTEPIENNLDFVDLYKTLGVGVVQLTYNTRNRVGYGCEEVADEGLTRFGFDLVARLNEARIIIDCSHTGERTSLDAIAHSSAPVVLSHSNVRSIHQCARNVSEKLIDAVAASGGVVGVAGFPALITGTTRPSLDQYISHIEAVIDRVGVEHVGLGLDYYAGQAGVASEEEALRIFDKATRVGDWRAYPPPPHHYPEGIDTPRTLENLTHRLLARGHLSADIRKILGANWLRVMQHVWGD